MAKNAFDRREVVKLMAGAVATMPVARGFWPTPASAGAPAYNPAAKFDLDVKEVGYDLCEPWRSGFTQGQLTEQQVETQMATLNNVCLQIRMTIRVVKPARGGSALG